MNVRLFKVAAKFKCRFCSFRAIGVIKIRPGGGGAAKSTIFAQGRVKPRVDECLRKVAKNSVLILQIIAVLLGLCVQIGCHWSALAYFWTRPDFGEGRTQEGRRAGDVPPGLIKISRLKSFDLIYVTFPFQICCCDSQNCNTPKPPVENPNLDCFTGLALGGKYTKGSVMKCADGQCLNMTMIVNKQPITLFTCERLQLCQFFGVKENTCKSVGTISGCCCDKENNCNLKDKKALTSPTPGVPHMSYQCYVGFQVDGGPQYGMNVSHCNGDCARYTMGKLTIYACDPSQTCQDFKLNNECRMWNGIKACCCKGSNCNDPGKVIVMNQPPVTTKQRCFVGVETTVFVAGGELPCAGSCMNVSATIQGHPIVGYMCDEGDMCRTLGFSEERCNYDVNSNLNGCCCDGDNCNIADKILPPANVGPTLSPIVCPQAVWVNGHALSSQEVICHGSCGKLALNTMMGSIAMNASIYTCDPSSYCSDSKLNLANNCTSINGSINAQACCCRGDMCMDPTNGWTVPKPPSLPPYAGLKCYVGLQIPGSSVSTGAEVRCPGGVCSNITLAFNNVSTILYTCDPLSVTIAMLSF
ncbi:hypothetical protein L596_011883 [Steinernema carpocapsae]|uniref:ET module n=1 Tax=Steinernema carpocapsae TaxID=34508 RepID=A0A4U5NW94_STECR|nr:hypothetical protein L596_011883 [Steinernema carpocapsae]